MAWTGGISVATPFFEVGFQGIIKKMLLKKLKKIKLVKKYNL